MHRLPRPAVGVGPENVGRLAGLVIAVVAAIGIMLVLGFEPEPNFPPPDYLVPMEGRNDPPPDEAPDYPADWVLLVPS